jgi:hypothetical protein
VAKIEDGRLLLPLSKSGKLIGDELGDGGHLVGRRAIGKADWDRTLRCIRPAPDLREVPSQEWRRPGADQVSPQPLLDPDDGTISWFAAGNSNCGERQLGALNEKAGESLRVTQRV